MATRSRIGTKITAKKVLSVYCHNDGYPEAPHGVGWVLHTNYRSPAKVAELIALGDLSSLGQFVAPAPGQAHGFGYGEGSPPAKDVTVAYRRDRDPRNVPESTDAELHGLNDWPDTGQEYVYLFNPKTGSWRVTETRYGTGNWVTLNDKFFKNKKEI
jgi:hypothetical protein